LVVEVHDVDGRLEKIAALLEVHGYEVSYEQDNKLLQNTPLYNLYAVRSYSEPGASAADGAVGRNTANQIWTDQASLFDDVHASLRSRLPEYMIPAAYVALDELPLTPNGKLDHRALPAPDGKLLSQDNYVPPQSEIEKMLASIWVELLQIDPANLSITGNFFSFGGNSLLVTRLVNRITQKIGIELPIQCVFDKPTIAQMADELEQRISAVPDSITQNVDKILESIDLIESLTEEELNSLEIWK
jgi:acyl carrier protein